MQEEPKSKSQPEGTLQALMRQPASCLASRRCKFSRTRPCCIAADAVAHSPRPLEHSVPAGSLRALSEATDVLDTLHQLLLRTAVPVHGFAAERRFRYDLQRIAELSGDAAVRATCQSASVASARVFSTPHHQQHRDALGVALLEIAAELENLRDAAG